MRPSFDVPTRGTPPQGFGYYGRHRDILGAFASFRQMFAFAYFSCWSCGSLAAIELTARNSIKPASRTCRWAPISKSSCAQAVPSFVSKRFAVDIWPVNSWECFFSSNCSFNAWLRSSRSRPSCGRTDDCFSELASLKASLRLVEGAAGASGPVQKARETELSGQLSLLWACPSPARDCTLTFGEIVCQQTVFPESRNLGF
jgi:hypothetical protein